jgi:flagellin-specific chaperone FliS
MYLAAYSNQYRKQDVMNASPLRLVIMTYDLAIRSCEQQDFSKSIKTISALRDCLDLDYPEVSSGLFSLYQWCMDCIRKGDYASATNVLTELRGAWVVTEQKITSRQVSVSTVSTAPAYSVSLGNILT